MNLPSNLFDGNINVQVILCQPDKTRIGELVVYDLNGTFKFNTYSEISFSIDRYYNDLLTGETKVNPYYKYIDSLRIIELRGVGHFVIQDVDENIEDTESISVTAFSLDYSAGQKYLESFYVNTGEEGSVETMFHAQTHGAEYSIDTYYKQASEWDKFERYYKKEYTNTNAYNYVEVQVLDENDFSTYKGTDSEDTLYVKAYPNVRFYWPTEPGLSLLHLIFAHIPEWEIGHVDKELWYEERTFSEDRVSIYDFLYNTAADTFKFVMVWDTVGNDGANTVSFYKTKEDGITSELIAATFYDDDIVYYDKDGNEAEDQPTSIDDLNLRDYYVKYDNVETQWDTDVFISRDNLASQIDISYNADDIKTKLKISGADYLDVRDVNLGQNYILNLTYYNTDEWMGKDLHAKYDEYDAFLKTKTVEYSDLISKWSAAYNEYSDLLHHVPVEPSVLLIGDEFDKLYCTYGLVRATEYVEDKDYYNIKGEKDDPDYDEKTKKITSEHYINTLEQLRPTLKKKLGLYRVGVADNGEVSTIDESDDVLLTLTNKYSDSATIRVRCESTASKYENYEYMVYRTLTTASSGLSETESYSIDRWIKGELTAKELGLSGFTVKSIGTLGAYLCIAKDETKEENIKDYGIKLLEEKRDTYATIFITQTEGYMSKEGSRCVAGDNEPAGASAGDKWLKTNADNATVYIYVGKNKGTYGDTKAWKEYPTDENHADFENYTRFIDNYEKLQKVQKVLNDKYLLADYLLNGVAINELYMADGKVDLAVLLRATIMHFIVLNNEYIISEDVPDDKYKIENMLWFQPNPYTSNTTIFKCIKDENNELIWTTNFEKDWNFNIILTDYQKDYGYITFMLNDYTYEKAEKFSDNDTYFIHTGDQTYKKFYVQPTSQEELEGMYVCRLSEATIIPKDTVCYCLIEDKTYKFTAPQELNKSTQIRYNAARNQLIINAVSVEFEETNEDAIKLAFDKVEYYVAKGTEYATYVSNGIPHVSYSHSQGLCMAKMNHIKELTDMNTYFSKAELMRLSPFIREDEYSDSNFLLTSYESEEEQMHIKQSLLDAGNEELNKICQPKFSFSATMANLLSIPEFAPIRWQFKLGNFIRVGIRDGYEKRARLLEVQINFEDASDFSCTFGDLISTKSEIDKHADLLKQAVTVSKSVASNQSNWQKGANKATELDQAINDGLKDAALSVGSANGQSIVWDQYGIRGRKLRDGSTNEYEDKQFALINNKLVFTDDNWQTSKAVVGEFEIELPNDSGIMVKQNMYGLLADAIVGGYIQGTEIRGGRLEIGGKNGSFVVNEDGSVSIMASDGTEKYANTTALDAIDQAYRYSVSLYYNGPTIFASTDDTVKTTITATVYERGEDITDKFSDKAFSWIRSSSDSAKDKDWNDRHANTSKTITIGHGDVIESSHFSCKVDLDQKTNT